jgi:hypothetical protein
VARSTARPLLAVLRVRSTDSAQRNPKGTYPATLIAKSKPVQYLGQGAHR